VTRRPPLWTPEEARAEAEREREAELTPAQKAAPEEVEDWAWFGCLGAPFSFLLVGLFYLIR
jgi:hypothetical protein